MNASRVKRAGLWTAAAVSVAVFAAQAGAQGAPVDLSPPTRAPAVPPQPVPPAQPLPRTDTPVPGVPNELPTEAPVMGGVVEAAPLGSINPDIAGALDEAEGGFGSAMWWGTDRRVVETFMVRLPVTSPSPAMRSLMRRLLLTGATIPEGVSPGTLIALRTGLLSAMGDFQGVNALMDAVPGYNDNPELLRVEMDTRLLTGDVGRSCEMAQAYIDTQKSLYWQKAFTFCQALDGQGEVALLGLSLLEELGVDDPVYFALVRAIANQSQAPVIESLPDPTPLHLAIARVAKAKLPADVIASNRPGVLRAIAISPNADAELRLEAAERAESAGALPVDALRQLYASISFTEDELKNPLTVAASRTGPMSRALLYRATLSQTVPAAQAEALNRALDMARAGGRYASTARAFLPQLTRVEPSTDLVWFAPEAIRAFLITGRAQAAQPWFDLLQAAAARDPHTAVALQQLLPVARLSGFEVADTWSMERLKDWWAAVKDTPDARAKASVLVAVLDGLGEYVPDATWVDLIDGPSHQTILAPHPSIWFLMDGASTQARVGETVLLSLVTLGEGGAARAEPIVLQRVLKAIRYVGLDDDARAMALEAVVAAGL